ncbi:very long-chain acyl-CoA synthetase [Naegleria gruberi]|uniref:Very long-chain acyl-CoA synthetase n=1 Tax=Naegleria gruberi TaxID=5762 RepID=D2W2Z8_NAEGR|nr:very long-chain acyl-CoA synthetase [Naegleria gruberi]EFC36493.1 very long-chain acyl-CoA synthetase [Naegleria gruberi]|eukprot:XP_002669237.1 very long-chain acyl-CoA synthetase [Naegleria gruberi strain NEG-M]
MLSENQLVEESTFMTMEVPAIREHYYFVQEHCQQTMAKLKENGVVTGADWIEYLARTYSDKLAIQTVHKPIDTQPVITYEKMNQMANQLAYYLINGEIDNLKYYNVKNSGLSNHIMTQGDVVCLLMENNENFIPTWGGLNKLGLTIACINTYLTPDRMKHAIELSGAKSIFLSRKMLPLFEKARNEEQEFEISIRKASIRDFKVFIVEDIIKYENCNTLENPNSTIYRGDITGEDALLYIYTSGTTGKSKCARFSNRRFIGAGVTWSVQMDLVKDDKYYIALPLYHGNGGVVAVSAIMLVGGTAVLREKFSASNFLNDIRTFGCTATIYIGELWRYLYNTPEKEDDAQNPLRVAAGNGLRKDIWNRVMKRFGIKKIVEHYGQTEMLSAHPMINSYNKVGSCGFIPFDLWTNQKKEVLLTYDFETDSVKRDPVTGFCEIAGPGVAGEDVTRISELYKAYNNHEDNLKKVYRDVFEKGDMWYRSGDLLKFDNDGFFYFVDRLGESYRWKGENVSTGEVSEAITKALDKHNIGLKEANVYGIEIPHCEGRAGMARLLIENSSEELDTKFLLTELKKHLPHYAIPIFLRISKVESEKTSTFKFIKNQYQAEAYHPDKVGQDQILMLDVSTKDSYIPITEEIVKQLSSGNVRL